ncbi:hypothetical protein PFICI_03038 [Pestalotiopsis fici W106-1]|uniref:RRM domain-containing protein n=1 Tax=Pestalotiopsis fici (strain W106-1 / CGMCC3.15140) TaxID=1229662 RepID=W3XFY7_PESFW|nr:uncharacterized protein PFICI_03038 [Pestalotiopsis fici W106-1]ETS85013.1 hypothetical protein PFICI_03038 [Pestalotiopsis fici W106-1]
MTQDQGPQGAASSLNLSRPPFAPLISNRTSPFAPASANQAITATSTHPTTTTSPAKSAMATSFMSPPPSFKNGSFSMYPCPPIMGSSPFDRDASMQPVGTPSQVSTVLIRRLPLEITEKEVELMLFMAQDSFEVQLLPPEQSADPGFCTATAKFRSPASAQKAKELLHGKAVGSADLIVDVLSGSPPSSRRNHNEPSGSKASSNASSTNSSGQSARFNGSFTMQAMDKISPSMGKLYGSAELPNPAADEHFQTLFSPQSPIGNHLTERARMSSRDIINQDVGDDEAEDLLNNLIRNPDNVHSQGRRATAPQLPVNRLASLSLNTNPVGQPSIPQYGHPHANNITPLSAHGNTMSPTVMGNASFPSTGPSYPPRQNYPPVNPADQNPPCNTLYVGNLPIDTSEEELKAMFSKQRGYKRLCFRTKQNGPMCFVEFEDISFATKALHELYGQLLHNSVKGGIRLSFSKNPLGVRSGPGQGGAPPMNGLNNMMANAASGFTTVNGPPPGLPGPAGLGRMGYGTTSSMANGHGSAYSTTSYSSGMSNGWSNGGYPGPLSTGGTSSPLPSGASSGFASYMMGK